MEYLEYTAFTKADRAMAWKLFSDFRFWPAFSDIYGAIRWVKGKPWAAKSRLHIEIVRPGECSSRSCNHNLQSWRTRCLDRSRSW